MSEDIFRHADRSLVLIFRQLAREFQRLSSELGFDELNVLDTRKRVNAMYKSLDRYVQIQYRDICQKAYREASAECGHFSDWDAYEFVYVMLRAYDPLTDYVYTREWTRKRDRLFESIIATQRGNQEMRKNLKRGMDVLANQIRQYADDATIRARIQAFRDAGIEYVRWIAENDEKTCEECLERRNRVYRLDDLPPIPAHWRCRCHIRPATLEEYERQQPI